MKQVIKAAGITIPADIKSTKELHKFLKDNIGILVAEKKSAVKHADAITMAAANLISSKYFVDTKGQLNKTLDGAPVPPAQEGPETVLVAINTTNWMDSHGDVHIPGIWNKSLGENKNQIHLQEHSMTFKSVISDQSKGYTQTMAWKDLGLDMPGNTEVLIFSTPFTGRNPYMEDQYRKGFVTNHSVGMVYVKLKLAINEPDEEYYKEEYANWVQYSPMIANLADAEAQGFFWAVLEAKVIEGSAVVKGSNSITPTIGFKSAQPAAATETIEPAVATQRKEEKAIDWEKIASVI
jgi:hypothetical protein